MHADVLQNSKGSHPTKLVHKVEIGQKGVIISENKKQQFKISTILRLGGGGIFPKILMNENGVAFGDLWLRYW